LVALSKAGLTSVLWLSWADQLHVHDGVVTLVVTDDEISGTFFFRA
jgi:hypothetical protein